MRTGLFALLFAIAGANFAAPYACPPPVSGAVVACSFASPGGTTAFTASVTAEGFANKGGDASLSMQLSLDALPCNATPVIAIPSDTSGQVSASCSFTVTSARPVTFVAVSDTPGGSGSRITLDAQITAFVPEYALAVNTSGNGTLASADGRIVCGSVCLAAYDLNARVALSANPAPGFVLGNWSGACSGNAATCIVTMTSAHNVTANFVADARSPVVEFHNTALDQYFITASPAEVDAIDAGSAGPGWSRTGLTFKPGGDTTVCRFYGSISPGPNSHFYSAFADECNDLLQRAATTPATQPRWNSEGTAFSTRLPFNGGCGAGTVPVYRAYNDGFHRSRASNHRFSTHAAAMQEVLARGWIYEGVAMCAPQ